GEAIETWDRVLLLFQAVHGPEHAKTIDWMQRLAWQNQLAEQWQRVGELRKEVVQLQEKRLGKDHWQVVDARQELADCERLSRMTPAQREELNKAYEQFEQARQLAEQGKWRETAQTWQNALVVFNKTLGDEHPHTANALMNLAQNLCNQGDLAA